MNMVLTKPATIGTTQIWGARIEPDGSDTWDRYELGPFIAGGGMGVVHELLPRFKQPIVAKLFNDAMIARIKGDPKIAMRLAALVRHRAIIAESLSFATWPRRILFNKHKPRDTTDIADSIIGFTMLKLDRTFSLHELEMAEDRRLRMTPSDTAHIAITIADQLSRMHAHPWGFVFGDLSPNNIHVTPDFKKVFFIDTDSFQFNFEAAKYTFTLGGITEGYTSPGAEQQLKATGRVSATHDDFVLAIHIFMLLMMDRRVPRHPFQSLQTPLNALIERRAFPFDNPQSYPVPAVCLDAYRSFPPSLRQAFTRTFTTPTPVTAREWTKLLSDYRRSLRPS